MDTREGEALVRGMSYVTVFATKGENNETLWTVVIAADIERKKHILKDPWVLTMEPKDQLADKPKEMENDSDDEEIEKSFFVIVYQILFLLCLLCSRIYN